MDYYSSLIYSAESDSKTLFRTILVFFTGKQINFSVPALLQLISPINSSTFLRRKSSISEVILVHPWPVIPDFFRTLDTSSLTCQLVNFAPTSNTELSNIANNIIMKSCNPLPATLLKQHFDLLLPILLSWRLSTCRWNPVIFRLLWKLLFYLHYLRKPT